MDPMAALDTLSNPDDNPDNEEAHEALHLECGIHEDGITDRLGRSTRCARVHGCACARVWACSRACALVFARAGVFVHDPHRASRALTPRPSSALLCLSSMPAGVRRAAHQASCAQHVQAALVCPCLPCMCSGFGPRAYQRAPLQQTHALMCVRVCPACAASVRACL